MFFYVVIIICVLLLSGLMYGKGNSSKGYFMASLLLTLVACFRFDVGFDYPVYFRAIDEAFLPILLRFEPLSLLISLPSILTGNPFLFFIISGGIIYPLVFYAFKQNSESPPMSLIIYVGLFYLISCSIIRQAIAISICLYAYKYIRYKSFSKYCICIIIATLFHYSAIASIVIYPIYFRFKIKHIIILGIALLLFRNVLLSLLSYYGIYEDYLSQLNDLKGGSLTKYFYTTIFISFFFIIKKKGFSIEEQRLLPVVLVGLFMPYLLGSAMGERIGYYFITYYCYLIPLLLRNKKTYKYSIYTFVFSGYFLAMIYFTANIDGQKSPYTPYQTIFNLANIEFKN